MWALWLRCRWRNTVPTSTQEEVMIITSSRLRTLMVFYSARTPPPPPANAIGATQFLEDCGVDFRLI
jgi:hypothetical protein